MKKTSLVRCLFIDDSEALFPIIKRSLRDHAEVDCASNAFMALQMLGVKDAYNLIICDVHMPRINGLQFVETLRVRGNETPVILISGDQDQVLSQRALELGVNDFLSKPIDRSQLQNAMENVLKIVADSKSMVDYQETGYVYDLFKTYYYDVNGLIFWMQESGQTLSYVRNQLEKKKDTGHCIFDQVAWLKAYG